MGALSSRDLQGVGFRVRGEGLGDRVLGFGFRVLGLGQADRCALINRPSGVWVSGFGFRVSGFGFRVSGLGFKVLGLGGFVLL